MVSPLGGIAAEGHTPPLAQCIHAEGANLANLGWITASSMYCSFIAMMPPPLAATASPFGLADLAATIREERVPSAFVELKGE